MPLTVEGFSFVGCISLFSTIFGLVFYIKGTQSLGPSSASIISNTETVITFVAAFLILGEILAFNVILGCALIVLASILVSVFTLRQANEKNDINR